MIQVHCTVHLVQPERKQEKENMIGLIGVDRDWPNVDDLCGKAKTFDRFQIHPFHESLCLFSSQTFSHIIKNFVVWIL